MDKNESRASEFRRNPREEILIEKINKILDFQSDSNLKLPDMPVLLVMGSARSGSTLITQYLASSGQFSFPSNLIARFPNNPEMGRLVQELLQQLNYLDMPDDINFRSNLGKTKGYYEPNEFWYLWRRHFDFDEYGRISSETKANLRGQSFLNGLAGLEAEGLPVALKGMIANWEIEFLHKLYPKFIFIHTRKELAENAYSILKAREKYFNDRKKWYSFKPIECENISDWNPYQQVVAQVYYTQKAIEGAFEKLPEQNKLEVPYLEICNNPNEIKGQLIEKINEFGQEINPDKSKKQLKFSPSEGLKNASREDKIGISQAIEWVKSNSKI